MAEIIFHYEGEPINIQCNKNEKMKDICIKLSNKINLNINSLIFLYGGNQLNLDKTFNEITKENKINILVYKNENEMCIKCGRILNNKIIDDIILLNNNINYTLIGLKSQIENIMNEYYENPTKEFEKLIEDFCLKDDKELIEYIDNIYKKIELKYDKTEYLNNFFNVELTDTKIDNYIKEYLKLIFERFNEL